MRKLISLLLAFILVFTLSACGEKEDTNQPSVNENVSSNQTDNQSSNDKVELTQIEKEMFTDRDCRNSYDESEAVIISLNDTSATATHESVNISDTMIKITQEGTYVISGTLSDGMVVVDVKDDAKVQLVLNNAHITSKTSAALYVLHGDKVFVTLAQGSTNTLENGGEFVAIDENNIDATLFSKQDLTMNGTGALTVNSPIGHGIVCKDDLVFTSGTYTINSASHGLDANDSVRIRQANLQVDAGKDGIHCENSDDAAKGFIYVSSGTLKVEAEGDGLDASSYLQIEGGTFDLLCGGGSENSTKEHSDHFGGFMGGGPGGHGGPGGRPEDRFESEQATTDESAVSMKGFKANGNLLIANGNITINAADDAIHSNTDVTVNGGTFTIASGDDALHAEENLAVTNGTIDISECYEGLEALHINVSGGDINLVATDDGLNAAGGMDESGTSGGRDGQFGGRGPGGNPFGSGNSNGSIVVSGGTLYINSSGDGMDANGTLEITGGHTTITGPTQGDTATLDYDKTGVITGGTFIGTGSTMMAQSFSDSTQGVIAVNAGVQNPGSEIIVKDSNGKIILSHQPELDYQVVIISTPELVKGETYILVVGSQSGEISAN